MLKRFASVVAIFSVFVLVLAMVKPGRGADTPYHIYVITSLTSRLAFIGNSETETFNSLEALVNKTGGIRGQPIKIVYEDDQSSPQVALELANQLISKNVNAFLGPTGSPNCRAILPLVQTSGPVDFCLSPAGTSPPGSYVFNVAPSQCEDITVAQTRYLRERGLKRIAAIWTTDATGQNARDCQVEALKLPENKGMSLVASEPFGVTDLTVQAQLAKIKAANPDALLVWCSGTPFETVLRGLQDTGWQVPVFMSFANAPSDQMKQNKGLLPTDLYSIGLGFMVDTGRNTLQRTRQRDFMNTMHSLGYQVDIINGEMWDVGLMLVSALRELGTNATAQQIHDWVLHQKAFVGISSIYDMGNGSQRGSSMSDILMVKWDPSQERWLQVSDFGGGRLRK